MARERETAAASLAAAEERSKFQINDFKKQLKMSRAALSSLEAQKSLHDAADGAPPVVEPAALPPPSPGEEDMQKKAMKLALGAPRREGSPLAWARTCRPACVLPPPSGRTQLKFCFSGHPAAADLDAANRNLKTIQRELLASKSALSQEDERQKELRDKVVVAQNHVDTLK
eukprot:2573811-Prymnesium_polylepis.1